MLIVESYGAVKVWVGHLECRLLDDLVVRPRLKVDGGDGNLLLQPDHLGLVGRRGVRIVDSRIRHNLISMFLNKNQN